MQRLKENPWCTGFQKLSVLQSFSLKLLHSMQFSLLAAVPHLWWCQISILLVKPEFSSVQSPILHVFLSWNSSKPITSVSKPTLFPFNRNLRHSIAHVWWSNPYVSWTFFIIYVIPIIYIYNYTKYDRTCLIIVYTMILYTPLYCIYWDTII
jgi:hypothetical protein